MRKGCCPPFIAAAIRASFQTKSSGTCQTLTTKTMEVEKCRSYMNLPRERMTLGMPPLRLSIHSHHIILLAALLPQMEPKTLLLQTRLTVLITLR